MKIASLVVFVSLTAAIVSADVAPPVDMSTRARGASRVVVAQVADVQAQFQTNRFGDQLIVSNVLLDVSETLKGSPTATLRVSIEGGTVGDLTLKVSDMPAFRAGDRAVFFLDGAAGDVQLPHERGRGILKLGADDRVQGSAVTLDDVRDQIRAALGQGAR